MNTITMLLYTCLFLSMLSIYTPAPCDFPLLKVTYVLNEQPIIHGDKKLHSSPFRQPTKWLVSQGGLFVLHVCPQFGSLPGAESPPPIVLTAGVTTNYTSAGERTVEMQLAWFSMKNLLFEKDFSAAWNMILTLSRCVLKIWNKWSDTMLFLCSLPAKKSGEIRLFRQVEGFISIKTSENMFLGLCCKKRLSIQNLNPIWSQPFLIQGKTGGDKEQGRLKMKEKTERECVWNRLLGFFIQAFEEVSGLYKRRGH